MPRYNGGFAGSLVSRRKSRIRPTLTSHVASQLKVRSMLAAGECRDLLGEREKAEQDYQGGIGIAPGTSSADTARAYLETPYRGE